ncbi:uncharacterized protein J3D65DRAFT_73820 [Phyllosticta citribraziliensis]|uniref:Uncharacterized protein n=1 Tax=Phyllosticta citribraziliensis TaxID=989973 RepID=A0ABR1LDA8_9PEZI
MARADEFPWSSSSFFLSFDFLSLSLSISLLQGRCLGVRIGTEGKKAWMGDTRGKGSGVFSFFLFRLVGKKQTEG